MNRVWVTTKVNTRRTKQFKVFREVNPVQSMSAKVIPIDIKLQRAWADYVSCRERAEASKNINDGIAAGNAWRRWLEMFTPKEPRPQ